MWGKKEGYRKRVDTLPEEEHGAGGGRDFRWTAVATACLVGVWPEWNVFVGSTGLDF